MRWQEACIKSDYKLAIRQNQTHIFLRHLYGNCTMHNKRTGNVVTTKEIEGYYDWQPYKEK